MDAVTFMADPAQSPSQPGRATTSDRARASCNAWRLVGVLVAAGCVGGLLTLHLPLPMAGTAALVVFCIGLWATAAVPEYWPALAFFLIAILFQLAPAETVFSGFHSSTFWLFFGGIVLGIAIRHTGLGQRIAQLLSSRLGDTYAGMIVRVTLAGLALAFIIPSSMARIFLLLPLIMAMADSLGYHPGSNGRTGMLIAAVFGTWAPRSASSPPMRPT
nr:SLC13 family permease [Halomonas socia]